jgi:hypothetical protein
MRVPIQKQLKIKDLEAEIAKRLRQVVPGSGGWGGASLQVPEVVSLSVLDKSSSLPSVLCKEDSIADVLDDGDTIFVQLASNQAADRVAATSSSAPSTFPLPPPPLPSATHPAPRTWIQTLDRSKIG